MCNDCYVLVGSVSQPLASALANKIDQVQRYRKRQFLVAVRSTMTAIVWIEIMIHEPETTA